MKNSAPILSVSGSAISKKVSSSALGVEADAHLRGVLHVAEAHGHPAAGPLDVVKLRVELLDVARGDVNAASGVRIFFVPGERSIAREVSPERRFRTREVSRSIGFLDRAPKPTVARAEGLRRDGPTRTRLDRQRVRGSRRGRAGRARARGVEDAKRRAARARIARSRAAAPRARSPRIRWRRKAHCSPRRAAWEATLGARGPRGARHADRAGGRRTGAEAW